MYAVIMPAVPTLMGAMCANVTLDIWEMVLTALVR